MNESPIVVFDNFKQNDVLTLLKAHRQKRNKPFSKCYNVFAAPSMPLILSLMEDPGYACQYIIADENQALINFWRYVHDNPEELIEHYTCLLQHYMQRNNEYRKEYYYQIQKAFIEAEAKQIINIKQAAQFAFLINNAEKLSISNINRESVQKWKPMIENNTIHTDKDDKFALRINQYAQLMKNKKIEFSITSCVNYLQQICEDDIVILDTSFIDMCITNSTGRIINEEEITQRKLFKNELKTIIYELAKKQIPFLICSGILGIDNQFSLVWPQGHLLRIISNSMDQQQDYIQHLYVSVDIAEIFINENYQQKLKANIQPLFHKLIEIHAQNKFCNRTAIVYNSLKYNYDMLNTSANQVANYLLDGCQLRNKLAVGEEILIALYLDRGPQLIMSWLGVLKSGAAYLPIDTNDKRLTRDAAYERIAKSNAKYLITHANLLNQLKKVQKIDCKINWDDIQILILDKSENLQISNLKPISTMNPNIVIDVENLAYVMYTSGSTGEPKGVEIYHRGLVYAFESHQDLLKLNHTDKVAQFASIGFDASLMEIMMALGSGGELHLVDDISYEDPKSLTKFLNQNEITVIIQTSSMLESLNSTEFPVLRALMIVGEPFDKSLSNLWLKEIKSNIFKRLGSKKIKTRKVVNGYGLTETTICTTLELCHPQKPLTIGKTILGCEVYLRSLQEEMDDQERKTNSVDENTIWLTPPNKNTNILQLEDNQQKVEGALYIAGPCLARGYWQRKDLTQDRFKTIELLGKQKRVYRSGDVGHFHSIQNTIELTGRIDRQVKIRGQRVELDELEEKIRKFTEVVQDVRVLAYDRKMEQKLQNGGVIIKIYKELVVLIIPHDNNLVITDPQNPKEENLNQLKAIRDNLAKSSANFILPAICNMRFVLNLIYKSHDKKNYNDQEIRKLYPNLPCLQLPHLQWEQAISQLHLNDHEREDFITIYKLCCDSLHLTTDQFGIESYYDSAGGDSIKVKHFFGLLQMAIEEGKIKDKSCQMGLKNVTVVDFARNPTVEGLWNEIQKKVKQVYQTKAEFNFNIDNELSESKRYMGKYLRFIKTTDGDFKTDGTIPIPLFAFHSVLGDAHLDYAGCQLEQLPFNFIKLSVPTHALLTIENTNFLDALVQYHVSMIRLQKPQGPYFLMGWSSGGLLATLAGNYLRNQNERVFVINIEGHHPRIMQYLDCKKHAQLMLLMADKIKDALITILNIDLQNNVSLIPKLSESLANLKIDLQVKCLTDYLRDYLKEIKEKFKFVKNTLWEKAYHILYIVEQILLAELYYPLDQILQANKDDLLVVTTHSEREWGPLLGWQYQSNQCVRINDANHFNLLCMPSLQSQLKAVMLDKLHQLKKPYYDGLIDFNQKKYETALHYFDEAFKQDQKDFDTKELSTRSALYLAKDKNEVGLKINMLNKAMSYGLHFLHIFEHQVNINKTKTALVWYDQTITYENLNQKVNRLARWLLQQGVEQDLKQREVLIAVYLENGPQYIISILAILKTGAAFVPLDVDESRSIRACIILKECGARYLITHRNLAQTLTRQCEINNDKLNLQSIVLEKDDIWCEKITSHLPNTLEINSNLERLIHVDDLAYVMYISGSTGKPRGVEICHRGLPCALQSHKDLLNLGSEDKIAQFVQITFDASILEIMMALGSGATLYVVPTTIRLSSRELSEFYKRCGITIAIFTPSMLHILKPEDFPNLRSLIVAGEIVSKELALNWMKRKNNINRQIITGYGHTETTIVATLETFNEKDELTIGTTALGLIEKVEQVNEEEDTEFNNKLIEQKDIEVGELYCAGPMVARGYWQKPELTNKRFKVNSEGNNVQQQNSQKSQIWFKTGDIVKKLTNDKLKYIGRREQLNKFRGRIIDLHEMEWRLKEHPEILNVRMIFQTDKKNKRHLAAYIVPKDKKYLTAYKEILDEDKVKFLRALRAHLKNYMPGDICVPILNMMVVENLIKENNDKYFDDEAMISQWPVPCVCLPSKQIEGLSYEDQANLNQLKKVFLDTLELSELQTNMLSYDYDFYELGGDSIRACIFIKDIKAGQYTDKKFQRIIQAFSIYDFNQKPSLLGIWHWYETKMREIENISQPIGLAPIKQRLIETEKEEIPVVTGSFTTTSNFFKSENSNDALILLRNLLQVNKLNVNDAKMVEVIFVEQEKAKQFQTLLQQVGIAKLMGPAQQFKIHLLSKDGPFILKLTADEYNEILQNNEAFNNLVCAIKQDVLKP